jgi:hypothetical protein
MQMQNKNKTMTFNAQWKGSAMRTQAGGGARSMSSGTWHYCREWVRLSKEGLNFLGRLSGRERKRERERER